MSPVKHAVISCAGMGSRLGLNMPKCLVEVGGRKIIDRLLELLVDVEDVRVVVGFMEEEVINHVKNIRSDVVFVRNPNYSTTSNSYSVHLATKDLSDPFLLIDGDLIIDQESFQAFLNECNNGQSLIGITRAKTEEAVFVNCSENKIFGFQRAPKLDYEWCGVAYLKDIKIPIDGVYIFQELEKKLPLTAKELVCYEIDTQDDLHSAMQAFGD